MSQMWNIMFLGSRKRQNEELVTAIKERLAFLRSREGYGTLPFTLGETNSLIWVLRQMGEDDE